ncbi:MAG: peptidylprolyl isomerase [Candidatus Doudnabacteria bacterium]|nr:peptidylprolyl isomerase [Candidatus Doudnabacteria bacterium]
MNSKFLAVIAVIVLGVVAGVFYFKNRSQESGNSNQEPVEQEQSTQAVTPQPPPQQSSVPEQATAVIEVEGYGTINLSLDGKAAPKTVANFIKLSKDGFYNGLKFHRVVPNFVIQGGDPEGTGLGGPGYTVPAEISLKHKKGAIAMARTDDSVNPSRASSGSQFYIAVQDLTSLDGQYTVFGYVTSGMDVVIQISEVPTEPGDYPIKDIVIKRIMIE